MEFWGVEVRSGESLKVDPGDDKIIHLSNACLGDVTKGNEPVALYVKLDNQKLVLGTLSSEKFPQISYDLIFEKEFELSHNWKKGSVFFTGFKAQSQLESEIDEDSDDFDEDIPVSAANGKPKLDGKNGVKPDDSASESDSDDGTSEEDKPIANGEIESSEGGDDSDDDDDDDGGDKDDDNEDDDDESDEEETPKKIKASNKRTIDSSKKTPVPVKKAKFVTPQKTDSKNVVHVATPHPSKQAGKATTNNKQQNKSGGDYSCKPCNRSFKTEDALNSHNRAKHSAK